MKTTSKLGIPAAALAALLATAAVAQEAGDQAPGQTMQDQDSMPGDMSGNMMDGDMSDMNGMMQMMEKMGPMMAACTEMMEAKANQTEAPATQPQDG